VWAGTLLSFRWQQEPSFYEMTYLLPSSTREVPFLRRKEGL